MSKCICGPTCDEYGDGDCMICPTLDPYEPCPVIGFGCGEGCECCTPEQQKAATR